MIKKSLIGITLLISGLFLAITASAATTCLLPSTTSGSQIVTCATPIGTASATTTLGQVPLKPTITYITNSSSAMGGSFGLFWGSSLPIGSWTYANYKVNSTITKPNGIAISVTEYTGFVVGTNTISVQACNLAGCGAWSAPKTVKVSGWTYNMCTVDIPVVTRTVTASSTGTVYGSGPFSSDSDMSTVARYLGAPVGKSATLTIKGNSGCVSKFTSGYQNGVLTKAYDSQVITNYALKPIKKGVVVTCVSGCATPTGTASATTTLGQVPLKPTITSVDGQLYMGGRVSVSWGSSLPIGSWTYSNYKVNNTVTNPVNFPGTATYIDNVSGYAGINVVEYTGFIAGTNTVSVQACNLAGCGAWSAPKTVKVSGWTYNMCTVDIPVVTRTVTASSTGTVYGSGPFSSDSDMSTVARYLGAPIGKSATLTIKGNSGCISKFTSGYQNGVLTKAYDSQVITNYALKPIKKGVVVTCVSGCSGSTGGGVITLPGATTTTTLFIKTKDGLIRTYTVHLPPSYDKTKAYKLVVALHGGFGSGASMETQTNLSKVADMRTGEKFIIVYPDGYKDVARAWNAGGCCGTPALKNINDVAFIKELVASLKTKYSISKVYATGMSNGGMLANRLACEASDIFTSVAPVSGTIQVPTCTPIKPIGMLMVHGTADTRVPYNGGFGTGKPTEGVNFVSVPKTLSDWAIRNKCSTNFATTVVPPLTNDGITIDKLAYSRCLVPTMLYRVNGGSHSWPGGTATSINILEDKSPTQSLNTSKVILDFFAGTSSIVTDPGTIVGITPLIPSITLMTGSVIDAIKADMTMLNEAPLLGISTTTATGWKKGSMMSMGGTPRGDNSPYYWSPANLTYKSADYWNAIVPWYTLHKGIDYKATNVRVKIYNITAYILKKSTNTWELVGAKDSNPTWAKYQKFDFGSAIELGNASARVEPDGKLSYKLTAESSRIHGGSDRFPITGSDVRAVFIHMTTELILDDPKGVDDRHLAQLLFSAAADYYPNMTTKVADYSPMTYAPNVAGSRHGLVSATPRIHYVATINPPGQAKDVSEYQKAGGISSISVAEFESNLPPNLTSGTVGLNSNFTLSWSSASSTVTDYQVKIDNGVPISKGTALSMTTTPASLKFVAGSTHTFSVRACNGTLCSAWSTGKVLTVSSIITPPVTINTPPTISGTPATSVTLGNSYTFTPTAIDINSDPLTFTIVNKPAWAIFDASTGKLSGTPTTVGTTTGIKISVTDGKSTAVSLPVFSVVVNKIVVATAKKLFASNFGSGVTLGALYNFSTKGAWQDLKGTDSETGYSFPVTGIPNQNFSGIQWIAYATITPDTIVNELSTEIRKVTGPTGASVNELFTSVMKKGPLGVGSAQAQFMVRRDHKYGDVNDMYITYWAKHPADLITKLDPTVSSANWHAQFEFKTGGYENTGNGDYRIQTTILKDAKTGKLYWMSKGDNVANGPWPRVDYWVEKNYDVPVPLDKWFKYEVYWHRSAGADGRYWTAVDGQVLFDHKGPNMGDYNLPINRIFFAPAYSGGNTPVESHITGLEIWDNFPCGTGLSCYKKTVTPPVTINTPPTISGTPATSVTIGNTYTFTPTAIDINSDPLTFTIVNKPAWAIFDASTGKLSGTPTTVGTTTGIKISVTDGKSTAVSLPVFSVVVSKLIIPPVVKKSNSGHYVTIGGGTVSKLDDSSTSTTDGLVFATELKNSGVKGVVVRYNWIEMEPTKDNYNFTRIKKHLDLLQSVGLKMVIFVDDKAFAGPTPLPDYLMANTDYYFLNTEGSYSATRWNPYVLSRFKALFNQLGTELDGHLALEGVTYPETSTQLGSTTVPPYDPVLYKDVIIDTLTSQAKAFPKSNVFWMMNYIPSGYHNGVFMKNPESQALVRDIANATMPLGVIMGGPDILPEDKGLVTRVYPFYNEFHSKGMKLFGSAQNSSFREVHSTSTGSAVYPTKFWTPLEIFQYGRDNLHVNYVFWNYKTWLTPITDKKYAGPGEYVWADAIPVIKANPVFNPVVPKKFNLNQLVKTTASVNVRSTSTTAVLGTQALGTMGTVVLDPLTVVSSSIPNSRWWKIDFGTGIDGWVNEDYIVADGTLQ